MFNFVTWKETSKFQVSMGSLQEVTKYSSLTQVSSKTISLDIKFMCMHKEQMLELQRYVYKELCRCQIENTIKRPPSHYQRIYLVFLCLNMYFVLFHSPLLLHPLIAFCQSPSSVSHQIGNYNSRRPALA